MKRFLFICILPLIFLSACSSHRANKVQPSSKDDQFKTASINRKATLDLDYPAEQYLTMTGIGPTEKMARENAIVEMGNFFESKVTSDISNKVKSTVTVSGGERVSSKSQQSVRVVSSVDFKGVQIASTWYDRSQMSYFAVAALEKAKAKTDWQRQVDRIDDKIEAELLTLKGMKSPFSRMTPLKESYNLWMERETVLSRLNVLGFKSTSTPTYDIKEIVSEISKIKSSIKINVNIKGHKYSRDVSEMISELLTKKGYLLKNKNSANIHIKGDLRIESVNLNSPDWEFARATISLKVIDVISGNTIGEVSENSRQGHSSFEAAGHKAVKQVSELVAEKLFELFKNI